MASVKLVTQQFMSMRELATYENYSDDTDHEEDPLAQLLELEQLALRHGFTDVHTFICFIRNFPNPGDYEDAY